MEAADRDHGDQDETDERRSDDGERRPRKMVLRWGWGLRWSQWERRLQRWDDRSKNRLHRRSEGPWASDRFRWGWLWRGCFGLGDRGTEPRRHIDNAVDGASETATQERALIRHCSPRQPSGSAYASHGRAIPAGLHARQVDARGSRVR